MASKYQNSYRRYYGRRGGGGSPVLKILLVVLAILVAAGLFFRFALDGRIERTEHGLRFVLPDSDPQVSQPAEPTSTPSLIIVEPSPTPTVSPEPEPEAEAVRAVEVTAAQLTDGTALQTVLDAGGNTMVVSMKNSYGRLQWQSQVGLADELAVSAGDGSIAQAVAQLAGSGQVRLVARVSCFRDQALVRGQIGGPLMTRGGNVWYDQSGLCWVSAADETVRAYLAALCRELADMGFDEILLEHAGYPDAGEVHVLAECERFPADRSAAPEQFLAQVREALEGTDTALGVYTTAEAVTGENSGSGITAELLARYADRVWLSVSAESPDPAAALSAAGVEGPGRLVTVGDQAADSWAIFNN